MNMLFRYATLCQRLTAYVLRPYDYENVSTRKGPSVRGDPFDFCWGGGISKVKYF